MNDSFNTSLHRQQRIPNLKRARRYLKSKLQKISTPSVTSSTSSAPSSSSIDERIVDRSTVKRYLAKTRKGGSSGVDYDKQKSLVTEDELRDSGAEDEDDTATENYNPLELPATKKSIKKKLEMSQPAQASSSGSYASPSSSDDLLQQPSSYQMSAEAILFGPTGSSYDGDLDVATEDDNTAIPIKRVRHTL